MSGFEHRLARDIIDEQFGPVVLLVAELLIQRFPGHASLETITRHCTAKKRHVSGSAVVSFAAGSGSTWSLVLYPISQNEKQAFYEAPPDVSG